MNTFRFILLATAFWLGAETWVSAQYQLKAGNFNRVSFGGPPSVPSPPPDLSTSQFSAVGMVSGSAGPIATGPTHRDRYPATVVPAAPAVDNPIVLVRATFGSMFASGVPRYSIGDVITPPDKQIDGITVAAASYWRSQPVLPGEVIPSLARHVVVVSSSTSSPSVTISESPSAPVLVTAGCQMLGRTVVTTVGAQVTLDGNASLDITAAREVPFLPTSPQALFPLESVSVTSASNDSPTVTITGTLPASLIIGATILGQPVTNISGTAVTLAAKANTNINGLVNVPVTPATSYYYSPHADKVLASQPGRVAITWVTRLPTSSGGYEYKTEEFSVSAASSRPVRTIFWTEGSFDGPRVQINDTRIASVNPVFNPSVPKAVAEEVNIPGKSSLAAKLTTLTFEKLNGIGLLSAYNVEGRLLVEYLGNLRLGTTIYEHLGFDVVDIERVPQVSYPTVNLGNEITPHDGDPFLHPSAVVTGSIDAASYYGTVARPDGSSAVYAERETARAKDPDDGLPATTDAYNTVAFYWLEAGSFGIKWPKFQDRYWQRWSPNLTDYVHYTVDSTGSTPDTGITFDGGTLPEIVYQDDGSLTEAKIDSNTQRLHVTFAANSDKRNRSLLKFSNNNSVWYVNLYTQAEDRATQRQSVATPGGGVEITIPGGTRGLEVGMVVSGVTSTGAVRIARIIDSTHIELTQSVSFTGTQQLTFTVESDSNAVIVNASATVGTRLTPPADHENAGFISAGTCYYPAGYINPFVTGVAAANGGAIIPVNARPTDNALTVRWFKKVVALNTDFEDFYVPGKTGRYTVSYPASTTPQIVIAQGVGTDDLPPAEAAGSIYYQNDSVLPGYNPNEEHALMLGGRAYALREDLNVTSGSTYTSQPFVLVAYTDPVDSRPAIHACKVIRSNATYDFDYSATAGTLLVKPYPLPLMPLAMEGTGDKRTAKDIEIQSGDTPANTSVTSASAYQSFTFKDRKGFTWVHRGAHDTGAPTFSMQLYYLSRPGFFVPGLGEPLENTILPFLRNPARSGLPLSLTDIDRGKNDEPLTIVYHPVWPQNAAELRVGETLTLPKFGLPQVRGQKSAQVFYQQSIANDATSSAANKTSVTLVDPTREKTVALNASAVGLSGVPAAIKTTSYRGKLYLQGLPPHLQQRIYVDPLRGAKGTLVLVGTFHDEIAGEDYLDLDMLSSKDLVALKGLLPDTDGDKSKWDAAIAALSTKVETFVPNTGKLGTYMPGPSTLVNGTTLATITDPDTAVDSYALTATGKGSGYVTLVFGNGKAFTPEGDPVQVKVIKVVPELYVGDLKVVSSSNPLDEQVTLRHSADFAGKPEDYEFQWRWATGAASAPATYASTMATVIGDPVAQTHYWQIASDPGARLPTDTQYGSRNSVPLPRAVNVNPVTYVVDAQGRTTTTIDETRSYTAAESAAGFPSVVLKSGSGVTFPSGVPGSIVFSADIDDLSGFVLYVNGRVALAHNSPDSGEEQTAASSQISPSGGLSKQFSLAPSFFSTGANKIEVAIYTSADPNTTLSLNFRLQAAQETDLVTTGTTWQDPTDVAQENKNMAVVGGSPTNPFGGPQFVLNDRWFTMRYRPKIGTGNVLASGTDQSTVGWSRWMPPQFVEGWVKRVLAAINPFEQRVKDLYNNQASTDVSVLTQAGTRWEGDIALTLDTVSNAGLIEIYETVLNRARSMSIDANTNDPDTNNALLLAAGYLSDLYTILGNEAYADAANPTISLDDQTTTTEVNTSRFSFEGQVASSLDEELGLLRGRDDSVSPGVRTAPAYNRLYWNYTRGINSGEVIYAVNYNIKEKVGSSTADGVIDESDAQRMFPQGHGDAYGHYLTALTGYYRLLTHPNFTWTPRAEAVTVLGQPVTVDFMDERKFAQAAGNLARTAQQICDLVYRKAYKDDPAAGWLAYKDNQGTNTQTGITSRQGLDEWVSRSAQGALYNWVAANAMLPDVDNYHTGVQKIDRTTVPEISELASASAAFQTTIDNANARLNPFGLNPGAIAFDLSPSELMAGHSHFEQVNDRALNSLLNAAGAFNQAAKMTRSLRNQQNQIDDYSTAIAAQEVAYMNELIDIFGKPYSGEIGAGKLYAQGYTGPDLDHWFIVDRPASLVTVAEPVTVTLQQPVGIDDYTGQPLATVSRWSYGYTATLPASKSVQVKVAPSQFVQYNDVWDPSSPTALGNRAETGLLQSALLDAEQTMIALKAANGRIKREVADVSEKLNLIMVAISNYKLTREALITAREKIRKLKILQTSLEKIADKLGTAAKTAEETADAVQEALPQSVGLATDATAPARGAIKGSAAAISLLAQHGAIIATVGAKKAEWTINAEERDLDLKLRDLAFNTDEVQLVYEMNQGYRDVLSHTEEMAALVLAHHRAVQNVLNVLAKGNRVLAEREIFRQRAAAVVQGYRTKDLTFRLFRNEALEQYRSLFDLASRYTYLAAKSYDYETGLLGSSAGQQVFDQIVAARALGDLTNGVPQSTTSTHGDGGLAAVLARLRADFSVAEGRLGINNPDQYGTVFSLRGELYRIQAPGSSTSADDAWRQTLEQHMVTNLMSDADVATQCRNIKKADGSAVPGIVIPFSTTIENGKNFFGLDLAAYDHQYTPSNFATKIYGVGIALPGYVGMDAYATGNINATPPTTNAANALSATPYVYLIPCGKDVMLAPALGDTNTVRSWLVRDQALPLPFNLGASDFNSTQFFDANGTLTEQPWIIRKHQAFRMVSDASFFYSLVPNEFTNSRLVGRSVWNTQWKIVIPAYTLLSNEQDGLNRFAASVKDIQLFLRTYSHSGN